METLYTILLWAIVRFASTTDCGDFKTGIFSLKNEELGTDHLIERTETTQTETDLKTGTKSKFRVTWINDCEYELTLIEGREEAMEFFKDKTLTVQITKTTDDGYSFDSFIRGTDQVVSHKVTRVTQSY